MVGRCEVVVGIQVSHRELAKTHGMGSETGVVVVQVPRRHELVQTLGQSDEAIATQG